MPMCMHKQEAFFMKNVTCENGKNEEHCCSGMDIGVTRNLGQRHATSSTWTPPSEQNVHANA